MLKFFIFIITCVSVIISGCSSSQENEKNKEVTESVKPSAIEINIDLEAEKFILENNEFLELMKIDSNWVVFYPCDYNLLSVDFVKTVHNNKNTFKMIVGEGQESNAYLITDLVSTKTGIDIVGLGFYDNKVNLDWKGVKGNIDNVNKINHTLTCKLNDDSYYVVINNGKNNFPVIHEPERNCWDEEDLIEKDSSSFIDSVISSK